MKFVPLAATAAALLLAGCCTHFQGASRRFDFALIGDTPYNEEQVTNLFPNMIAELNAAKLAFVVHDGDIKSGGSPCTDEGFLERLKQFQTIQHPFIYTFGDNEWTDCGKGGGLNPTNALERLREVFTQGDQSLGQHKINLTRQSNDPKFAKFRENVRWTKGNLTFATLHIVGSANNYGKPDFAERNAANLAWLHDSFAHANREHHRAIMIITQASPFTERGSTNKVAPGFQDFHRALLEETLAFEGQVVFVHGDSHYFRIDKPLMSAAKKRVENFTRAETFGDPDVHWLRATADETDPNVFTFRQQIVKKNLVKHLRR